MMATSETNAIQFASMSKGLEIPPHLSETTPLTQVFEGRFAGLFARHGLETIADLKQCPHLTASEVHELNAWLRRCWWFW